MQDYSYRNLQLDQLIEVIGLRAFPLYISHEYINQLAFIQNKLLCDCNVSK